MTVPEPDERGPPGGAGDLARTLAFAFRRKGAQSMPGADLRLLLAYDLRWFAPEDAKRAVQRALDTGLLVTDGEHVRPGFDVAAVAIPVNFRPGPRVLEEEVSAAPPAPARAALAGEAERAAEDERRKRGLLLSVGVARLVVRRRAGEDVTAEAAAVEADLLRGGAPPRA